jgi:hypothetical protein
MADKQGYRLAPNLAEALTTVMAGIDRAEGFANGRSARGLPGAGDQRAGDTAPGPGGVDLETLPDEELTVLTMGELPRQLR